MIKMNLETQVKYQKGGNEGSITFFPHAETPFLAVTATASNWYKTQLGAQKFMAKKGYEVVEDCKHEENETINITGTDETIVICHDCGNEI